MQKRLTIITTLVKLNTLNRVIQIERFIKYHLHFDCQIVIISPDDVELTGFDLENVKVIDCNHTLSIEEKLLLALENVQTPYVSWVADDDFLGLDFAVQAINELDTHEFIAGCDGFMFFLEEKTLKRRDIKYSYYSYQKGLRLHPHGHKGKRFRLQADFYHPGVIHGIIRTHVMIQAIKFIQKYQVPVNFGDRVFIAILMVHGDIKFLNTIASVRSYGTRIMHHNPSLFNKANLGPRELIMDQQILEAIFQYYEKEHGKLTPGIKAEILYFLMKSSKALNDYSDKTTLKYKLSNFYHLLQAYLEPIKLAVFNKRVREDIKFAKKYMKEYSLKGDV